MAKVIKECRICGKEYEVCNTAKIENGVYRWQDVACCPEHGEQYLREILESRGLVPKKTSRRKKKEVIEANTEDT